MFGRPAPNEERYDYWKPPEEGDREIARRWIDLVEPLVVATAHEHRNRVLPVVPDRPSTEREIRQFYRYLLEESSR
jgi:hypothetical protein